jgi:conjugal transfer pilus assembly protein TraW
MSDYIPTMRADMIAVLGTLFQIEEMNIKDVLMKRMQKVNLKQAEKEVQERIKKSIKRPKPAFQNSRCLRYKTWLFDPTAVLEKDIVDHKGHVLKKKGATYNPLSHRQISTQMVFIEGDDPDQIVWALKQPRSKIVLVNGAPIDLEEKYQVPVYFDQRGFLCRKFGISAFPARVFQQNDVLRCEEIALEIVNK